MKKSKTVQNLKINKDTLGDVITKNLEEIFYQHYDLNPNMKYNVFDHMYLVTYFGNSGNPKTILSDFKKINYQKLLKPNLRRGDVWYLQNQHAGYFFVDYRRTKTIKRLEKLVRATYSDEMYGIHLHGLCVVHPDNHQNFLDSIANYNKSLNAKISKSEQEERGTVRETRGLHLERIRGTRQDALNAITYSMKSVVADKGFFFNRDLHWDCIGPSWIKPKSSKSTRVRKTAAELIVNPSKTALEYRSYDPITEKDAKIENEKNQNSSDVRAFSKGDIAKWEDANKELLKPKAGASNRVAHSQVDEPKNLSVG